MYKSRAGKGCVLAMAAAIFGSAALALAQSTAPASQSQGSPASAASGDEVALLKRQLAEQEKQLAQMQATMEQMKARIDHAEQASQAAQTAASAPAASVAATSLKPSTSAGPASLGQVASLSPVIPKTSEASAEPAIPLPTSPYNNGASPADEQGLSPLAVKIGGATFTPGGFMDFTVVGRSTNVGSGIGTSFGGVPYSGTTAGSLSETRFSMQNSRLSMDVNAKYVGFDWHGHVEADFLGNAPANVFVGSNSNTLRSRLYWIDGRKGKFEFLGGQSWSMLTPNRNGLSANPSDIFYSQDMDTNYQVGLTWSRQAQFRLIYHPTDIISAGISIEDPQQFVGGATVPSSLASEVETGGGNTATPNVAPDVIAKIAFDPKTGPLHQHIEIAGLATSARIYDPAGKVKNGTEGGGVAVNFNFELVKNLHAILNTFYSDGGGRYIFALGPQFTVDRNSSGFYQPVMDHSGSGIAGFEYQVNKQTMFYGYYGGAYFGRSYGIDCYLQPVIPPATTAACNSTVSSKPSYIGYGYPGSPNSQNRSVQEGTFGVIETFWKDPHYGALQLITQYSYVNRDPWVVAGPKNAHASMAWVDLRYVLP